MRFWLAIPFLLFIATVDLPGQTSTESPTESGSLNDGTSVPLFIRFSGTLSELNGTPSLGAQNVTFALYKQESGGTSLWSETESVVTDGSGSFNVLLGAASSLGIPAYLFASGDPRWIGITPSDGIERARSIFVSVPYALKAVDADTLGGKRQDQFISVQQFNAVLNTLRFPGPVGPIPSPCLLYTSLPKLQL